MSRENQFDVIVVGAGPAGAMAARYAAEGGCRVALLERKKQAGIPVRCGEGVGLKGLSFSIEIDRSWIQTTIKKVHMFSPGGYKVDLLKIGESYVLNREIMDNDLVQRAVKSGASYFPNTPVLSVKYIDPSQYECVCPQNKYYSSCIILADGVESRCARDLGWDTSLSLEDIQTCAFCRIKHDSINEDTMEFHIGNRTAPGGYAWVIPRCKGMANVGLGVLGTKSTSGKPYKLLNEFVNSRFPGSTTNNLHFGGVPVGKWLKPLVKDGIMIVGDAARQVNSLNGGGVAYALFAGKIAGETAAGALSKNGIEYKHLKQYQKKWAAYCGKQQMRSYSLKSMLLKAHDNDIFYDNIARILIREKPEKLGYLKVFLTTFARHPMLLYKAFLLFSPEFTKALHL